MDVFWGAKVFCHFVTQYCELQHETTCARKSADAAFRCVQNLPATRSGGFCGDKSVSGLKIFKLWPPSCQPKTTHETDIFKPQIQRMRAPSLKGCHTPTPIPLQKCIKVGRDLSRIWRIYCWQGGRERGVDHGFAEGSRSGQCGEYEASISTFFNCSRL